MTAPVYDLVTIGETLGVFGSDAIGRLTHGSQMTFRIAGAESNVAIAMQRIGYRTQWVSALGEDDAGHAVLRELRAEGVDARVTTSPDHPTGMMVKIRRSLQALTGSYFREGSAFARASSSAFDLRGIPLTRCFHFSGISLTVSDGAREAIRTAIDLAHDHGALVSMDVNHRRHLWRDDETAARTLSEFSAQADVLFASPDEAALIVGTGTPEAQATDFLERGVDTVVIKLGKDGALARRGDEVVRRGAVDVDVVDAVGAGDALAAGFLAARLAGRDLGDSLVLGNQLAAFAISAVGDWENLPEMAELDFVGMRDMHR